MTTLRDETVAQALPELRVALDLQAIDLGDLADALSRAPSAVLSPLFWSSGDALETARILHAAGFSKPYRVLTPDLPKPELVLREFRQACPGLDIDLVPTPDLGL